MNVQAIQQELREFAESRGLTQYHGKAALAQALAVETGELLELFLWGTEPSGEVVADEVADVAIFLLRFCDRAGIDLERAVLEKMAANWQRRFDGPRVASPVPRPGPVP